jgi:hypothetical protein
MAAPWRRRSWSRSAVVDPIRLIAELARRWVPPRSLVPALAADAALAYLDAAVERDDPEAARSAVPHLLELAVEDRTGPVPVWEALDGVRRAGWPSWPPVDRDAVTAVLDGWWRATLIGHPSRPAAPDVLAAQARLRGEVRPLLDRWLNELDGAGAVHLAEVIRDHLDPGVDRLVDPAWAGYEDLATQVAAWARSEAVVLGLTLVGGTHLDDDLLSQALDRLI